MISRASKRPLYGLLGPAAEGRNFGRRLTLPIAPPQQRTIVAPHPPENLQRFLPLPLSIHFSGQVMINRKLGCIRIFQSGFPNALPVMILHFYPSYPE
jgi:hypothetical protein